MRSFSNIMPNFAGYLHLLVDSIPAVFSYNKCYFVSIIQRLQSHHLQREKTTFLHHFLIPNRR